MNTKLQSPNLENSFLRNDVSHSQSFEDDFGLGVGVLELLENFRFHSSMSSSVTAFPPQTMMTTGDFGPAGHGVRFFKLANTFE